MHEGKQLVEKMRKRRDKKIGTAERKKRGSKIFQRCAHGSCNKGRSWKAENNREEPKEVDRRNENEMLGKIFIMRREMKSSDRERKSVRMLMYVASISCICVRALCTLKCMCASTRHTGGE